MGMAKHHLLGNVHMAFKVCT